MATVNQNMFDASVSIHRAHEASLMVLPLNLMVKIIAYVGSFIVVDVLVGVFFFFFFFDDGGLWI